MEEMKDTKKNLLDFLNDRLSWFVNYEKNPFREMKMYFYILNGINALAELEVQDDAIVIMYDEDDVLKFKLEA